MQNGQEALEPAGAIGFLPDRYRAYSLVVFQEYTSLFPAYQSGGGSFGNGGPLSVYPFRFILQHPDSGTVYRLAIAKKSGRAELHYRIYRE